MTPTDLTNAELANKLCDIHRLASKMDALETWLPILREAARRLAAPKGDDSLDRAMVLNAIRWFGWQNDGRWSTPEMKNLYEGIESMGNKPGAPQAAPSADEREKLAKLIRDRMGHPKLPAEWCNAAAGDILAAGYRKSAAQGVAEVIAWLESLPTGRLQYPHEIIAEIRRLSALPKGQEDE